MQKYGKAEDRIYELICQNPGLNTYKISKRLNMSGGNARNAISNLHKKGLVFFKFNKRNPRIEKCCFAVDGWKLLPKNFKNGIRKLI